MTMEEQSQEDFAKEMAAELEVDDPENGYQLYASCAYLALQSSTRVITYTLLKQQVNPERIFFESVIEPLYREEGVVDWSTI